MTYVERTLVTDITDDAHVEDVARYEFAGRYTSGKLVLDVACGTGYGSCLLRARGKAESVLGVDGSPDAIAQARRFEVPGVVDFAVADVSQLPLKDESVDVAVSLETVEHLVDPLPFLYEIRRVLRHHGCAIISTPLNDSELRFTPSNPFHVREYSASEFTALLSSVFSHVAIWYQTTEYGEDRALEVVSRMPVGASIRAIARELLPMQSRTALRAALGWKGLRPRTSSVTQRASEDAHVQIAVCG